MKDVTSENFGYLIAYLLPGFVALWGVSSLSPTVQGWLGTVPGESPTVGGFLYVTLGSLGAGLIASTVRWLLIDTLHHHTGIPAPRWDFSTLSDRAAGFTILVEIHYRYYQFNYYQFNANSLIALTFAWACQRLGSGHAILSWFDMDYLVLAAILFVGSRDTLRKYYHRTADVLTMARRLPSKPAPSSSPPQNPRSGDPKKNGSMKGGHEDASRSFRL